MSITTTIGARASRSSQQRLRCECNRQFHQSRAYGSAEPAAFAEGFLSKFAKGKSFTRKQFLDPNQLRLLSLTLNRPTLWQTSSSLEKQEPQAGTPVPPAYHNAYFTPTQLPDALGLDGTDTSYNPDPPFTRRMWAGGSIHWPGADPSSGQQALLRVGEEATEVTKVLSCEPKTIKKTGEAMLVVGVAKEFFDAKDRLCVVDNRNWVFRKALDPNKKASSPPKPAERSMAELEKDNEGKTVRYCKQDAATLFRFSALTFNAHRIHYDKPWAIEVEGHRDAVVHGPLNMIAMLDLWRDNVSADRQGFAYPKSLEYRATSPVYVEEGYRVLMDPAAAPQKMNQLQVVSNDGTPCMKGTIHSW